ncbi:MAG: hypothetical protein ACI4S2_04235 [Lachnospiraceae bacterium]
MTLKEAYEIQRKELIALRRENARLKEDTYTDAEKLEHEKITCHLRFENQSLAKDKERYHHLWRDALTRPDHLIEDLIKIDALEKEIRALKYANEHLSDQLQEAQDVIAKLKAQMNRDHENSSLPSSVKPFHIKVLKVHLLTTTCRFSSMIMILLFITMAETIRNALFTFNVIFRMPSIMSLILPGISS